MVDCTVGMVPSAARASPVAAPSATPSSPVPTLFVHHDVRSREELIKGPGIKVQNWRRQVFNKVRAKRAYFWGVNAILDPSNTRRRPKNGRNSPVGCRGNPPQRPRGAEVPPSASSLRTPRADTTGSRALALVCVAKQACALALVCVAKQARANELIAEGDSYSFTASTISRSGAHLETEETPLLLWSRVIPAGTDFQNFSPA